MVFDESNTTNCVSPKETRPRIVEVTDVVVRRVVAGLDAAGVVRIRVEIPVPALAGAVAGLVIAADHDPRRGRQQRRPRREEVRRPDVGPVAPRRAGAGRVARWARVVAVLIVADVEDEVGLHRRGRRCVHGEGPDRRIAAGLVDVPDRDAAAGVAEDDDAVDHRLRQRQLDAGHGRRGRAGGEMKLAGRRREYRRLRVARRHRRGESRIGAGRPERLGGRQRADRHGARNPVDRDRRAHGVGREEPRDGLVARPRSRPRPTRRARRRRGR